MSYIDYFDGIEKRAISYEQLTGLASQARKRKVDFKKSELLSDVLHGLNHKPNAPLSLQLKNVKSLGDVASDPNYLAAVKNRTGDGNFTPDRIAKLKTNVDSSTKSIVGRPIINKSQNYFHLKDNGVIPETATSRSKEIISRISDHHEVMEGDVKKEIPFYGHSSPEVILKERNMLKTLPNDEHSNIARDTFYGMRNQAEYSDINRTLGRNVTSPDAPRLSRHAIKRIGEVYNKPPPFK